METPSAAAVEAAPTAATSSTAHENRRNSAGIDMGAIGIAAAMSENMKTAATAAANMRNLLEAIFPPPLFLSSQRSAAPLINRTDGERGAAQVKRSVTMPAVDATRCPAVRAVATPTAVTAFTMRPSEPDIVTALGDATMGDASAIGAKLSSDAATDNADHQFDFAHKSYLRLAALPPQRATDKWDARGWLGRTQCQRLAAW